MSSKVTNKSVGDALGLDQSYVSLIRRGKRIPSRDVLVLIIKTFECSSEGLMKATVNPAEFARYFNKIVGFAGEEPVE